MIADGFLVVDKPPGLTSHDVVAVVRAVTGLKKVGHTGTLDPFATGVLPVALGGATRLIQFLDEREKLYDATIELGRATDTGDPTGTTIAEADVPALTPAQIDRVLATFVGPRMQTPPRYSAVKVKGRPLYAYARKGAEVQVEARPIEIFGLTRVAEGLGWLRVTLRCSRGTYARVLAEELGVALGSVGHLAALRRLGSGGFGLDRAVTFAQLAEAVAGDPDWGRVLRPSRGDERVPWRKREDVYASLAPWITPPAEALRHLPRLELSVADARRFFRTGTLAKPLSERTLLVCGAEVIGIAGGGAPVALARENVPGASP